MQQPGAPTKKPFKRSVSQPRNRSPPIDVTQEIHQEDFDDDQTIPISESPLFRSTSSGISAPSEMSVDAPEGVVLSLTDPLELPKNHHFSNLSYVKSVPIGATVIQIGWVSDEKGVRWLACSTNIIKIDDEGNESQLIYKILNLDYAAKNRDSFFAKLEQDKNKENRKNGGLYVRQR